MDHRIDPAAMPDPDPVDPAHTPDPIGQPWFYQSCLVHEIPHEWAGSTITSTRTAGAQEPTVAMVEAVGVLRAGLSAVGLDELAARLSEPFWSMRRDDQDALLAEAAAELRRVALTSQPGRASAPGVSSYVREPVSFHYFLELEGETSADHRPLNGFADADRWLLNDDMTDTTKWLTSAAEDVLRMPWQPSDYQGPTSWTDGTFSDDPNNSSS